MSRCKGCDPDLIARNPAALRRAADVIEAEKAEKAERDKAIEELCEISVTGALLTVSLAAAIYDAGWRKR